MVFNSCIWQAYCETYIIFSKDRYVLKFSHLQLRLSQIVFFISIFSAAWLVENISYFNLSSSLSSYFLYMSNLDLKQMGNYWDNCNSRSHYFFTLLIRSYVSFYILNIQSFSTEDYLLIISVQKITESMVKIFDEIQQISLKSLPLKSKLKFLSSLYLHLMLIRPSFIYYQIWCDKFEISAHITHWIRIS